MSGISDAVVIGVVLGLIFAAATYYLYSRIVQQEKKIGLMETILLDLKVTTEQALLADSEQTSDHSTDQPKRTFVAFKDDEDEEGEEQDEQDEKEEQDERNTRLVTTRPEPKQEPKSVSITKVQEQEQQQQQQQSRPLIVEQQNPQFVSVKVSSLSDIPTNKLASWAQPLTGVEEPEKPKQIIIPGPPVPIFETASGPNYEANTYRELCKIGKHKGVTGATHMSKPDLIKAIRRIDAGLPQLDHAEQFEPLLKATAAVVAAQQKRDELKDIPSDVQGTPLDDDESEGYGEGEEEEESDVEESFVN